MVMQHMADMNVTLRWRRGIRLVGYSISTVSRTTAPFLTQPYSLAIRGFGHSLQNIRFTHKQVMSTFESPDRRLPAHICYCSLNR